MKTSTFISTLLLVVASANCLGHGVIEDQSSSALQSTSSITHFAPIGQSFVPQHDRLGFVELQMLDGGGFPVTAEVKLVLRRDTISGQIVGESAPVLLEDCFNRPEPPGCGSGGGGTVPIRFQFSPSLMLTTGNTYVFEIVSIVSGAVNVGMSNSNAYSNGNAIINGGAESRDLHFITGGDLHAPCSATELESCDLNGDGLVNLADILFLQKALLKDPD